MADAFSINADRAVKALKELSPRLQKSAINKAARKAMAIVRDSARARAKQFDDPETPSPIWKRIAISPAKYRKDGNYVMRVGVQGGARSSKSKEPPWYWRLIELGTQTQQARPFMLPALESSAQAVGNKFAEQLNTETDKIVAKMKVGQ